ncbi:DnaJ domain-containing protein [Rufibacter sediminis]|uniref:DnaJ domain-containing protein n=1 Tax=Rufibacter sediminis TaxID=2762756 RepID=A0ABR6VTB2_9BACT|nr:DnaJ domain-containing protein [Rufibacter sediminis]MBC3539841.1 DnaJ domain-containing protein [Rufibacter sediminis]
MNKNYYQLLGIKETATHLEIKEAYRKLSKKVHPDLNQGEVFFEEYFKEVKEAYETLSDQEKKRNYDTRRFRPSITASAPVMPSNLKNLEYQVGKLELRLRDQTEQYNQLLAEKKALNQEMEHFVRSLFEVKNERNFLQTKVKELEKETLALRKGTSAAQPGPSVNQQLELHRQLQVLEQELKNTRETASGSAQQLARETQMKQALEKRVQELLLEAAQLPLREKELQALTQEREKQQARITELEKQTTQVKNELEGRAKELALAMQQRKTLQEQLQELEHRLHQQPTPVTAAKGEKKKQQHQILEATTQKQALQNQVHDLELTIEQLKQVLQEKTKALQQEKTLQQELRARIQQLEEENTHQKKALDQNLLQLQQEAKTRHLLQEKVHQHEAETTRHQALLQTKTQEHTQLSRQFQELQGKLQTLTQEETKLRATLQKLEQQAARDKAELQAKDQSLETSITQKQALQKQLEEQKKTTSAAQQELQKKIKELEQETSHKRTFQSKAQELEKEKAAQHLKVSELQKEIVSVKSRFTHLAHLQPFLVEHMDFFNSALPDEYGTSFDRSEIKYIFSRIKIAVLADKPGKLNVLVKYLKPSGQLYFNPKSSPSGYSFAATLSYSPQEEYLYLSGWGSDRETTFVGGDHRVEIYDETGRQLARANFLVKDKLLSMSKIKSFF